MPSNHSLRALCAPAHLTSLCSADSRDHPHAAGTEVNRTLSHSNAVTQPLPHLFNAAAIRSPPKSLPSQPLIDIQ